MLKMTKIWLVLFQILTCLYFLKKVQEVKFIIFLIDTAKPIINIQNLMTQNKNQNIIYLEANNLYGLQCLNLIQQADSNK